MDASARASGKTTVAPVFRELVPEKRWSAGNHQESFPAALPEVLRYVFADRHALLLRENALSLKLTSQATRTDVPTTNQCSTPLILWPSHQAVVVISNRGLPIDLLRQNQLSTCVAGQTKTPRNATNVLARVQSPIALERAAP